MHGGSRDDILREQSLNMQVMVLFDNTTASLT